MARYVVLSFEDNDDAEHLIQQYKDHPTIHPVGMFARPTNFCEELEHWDYPTRSKRGVKFGWWICPQCHKARKLFQQGHNMLDPEKMPLGSIDRPLYLLTKEPLLENIERNRKCYGTS